MCDDKGDNRVLQHCHTQSFVIEDEYYFVTAGVQQSQDAKDKNLKRYKSILNVQKFDKSERSVKQIFQTELNDTALNQYIKLAKQFIVYNSNLYYYQIRNSGDKKVVYILCKYSFGDLEAEEIHRNEETVESPIYFVSFAEQPMQIQKTQAVENNDVEASFVAAATPRNNLVTPRESQIQSSTRNFSSLVSSTHKKFQAKAT